MSVRRPLVALCALSLFLSVAASGDGEAASVRVVSLGPSLTATLLAIGAEDALVGVDARSAQLEPRVGDLPVVGGLFNPSLEAIVALAPNFVALVPSAQQRGLHERLEALGVEVLALPNIRYEDVLRSIEVLGERVGRAAEARARAGEIRAAWDAARARSTGRSPTRAVIVIQRDPLFVVGGGSFLDAMLRAAGAENIAGGFEEPYPRVSDEWLIAAEPELLLDADPSAGSDDYWARWPSLPAVASGRVRKLAPEITVPGPYLDLALASLEREVRESAR